MISDLEKTIFYKALLAKDHEFDGIFFVGVKTTGVFCHPTCPARKPKFSNCEFFRTAEEALLASFRPCKRCQPLSHPGRVSPLIEKLVAAVEAEPQKRWREQDFIDLGIDLSTARRQFKKRFGMTLIEYTRARRMGLAMKHIRTGKSVIESQLEAGYESDSGFRDAFSKIMGTAPSRITHHLILKATWLDTPLGPMIAMGSETELYLLEFIDRRGLEREIERLRKRAKAVILPGETAPIHSIRQELQAYFAGKLTQFNTPLHLLGSPFQQQVWRALQKIPSGQTCSYQELATQMGRPTSCRAVANANGANQIAIVIPCHRVINTGGALGGYGGGVSRKQWLLSHENQSSHHTF